MRFSLIALAAFPLITSAAAAQLATSPDANPLGTWRGSSRCVVRPSDCTDETIVYRIVRKGINDSLSVDARKVVDEREQEAGLLACQLNAPRAYITCLVPEGRWRFTVRHDSLIGQLRLLNGTWVRELHAVRSGE